MALSTSYSYIKSPQPIAYFWTIDPALAVSALLRSSVLAKI